MNGSTVRRCLTIAGSDSGGGAGIQADLKTFTLLGCFGTSAITAITAQNTERVNGIWPLNPDAVVAQICTVLEDIGADSIKIGMLFSADIVEAVAELLGAWSQIPLVLDPVMISKAGSNLLDPQAVLSMQEHLLPIATVVTPNLPELAVLTGMAVDSELEIEQAAANLATKGAKYVFAKGGHREGKLSKDFLYSRVENISEWHSSPRIDSKNTHGTGCTLSAAIAAYLAQGLLVRDAIRQAKEFVQQALMLGKAHCIGSGFGPVLI